MVTPRHFFLLQTTKRTIFILEPRFQCLIFFVLDSIRTVTAIDHIATMKQARADENNSVADQSPTMNKRRKTESIRIRPMEHSLPLSLDSSYIAFYTTILDRPDSTIQDRRAALKYFRYILGDPDTSHDAAAAIRKEGGIVSLLTNLKIVRFSESSEFDDRSNMAREIFLVLVLFAATSEAKSLIENGIGTIVAFLAYDDCHVRELAASCIGNLADGNRDLILKQESVITSLFRIVEHHRAVGELEQAVGAIANLSSGKFPDSHTAIQLLRELLERKLGSCADSYIYVKTVRGTLQAIFRLSGGENGTIKAIDPEKFCLLLLGILKGVWKPLLERDGAVAEYALSCFSNLVEDIGSYAIGKGALGYIAVFLEKRSPRRGAKCAALRLVAKLAKGPEEIQGILSNVKLSKGLEMATAEVPMPVKRLALCVFATMIIHGDDVQVQALVGLNILKKFTDYLKVTGIQADVVGKILDAIRKVLEVSARDVTLHYDIKLQELGVVNLLENIVNLPRLKQSKTAEYLLNQFQRHDEDNDSSENIAPSINASSHFAFGTATTKKMVFPSRNDTTTPLGLHNRGSR